MTEIEQLADEIERKEQQIRAIERQLSIVKQRHQKLLSQQFIAAHGIKKEDVESSSENSKWFGTIEAFADWLRTSNKPWCEWNGSLMSTSDVITGRFKFNNPGRYEDLL